MPKERWSEVIFAIRQLTFAIRHSTLVIPKGGKNGN
jgi:hypothetical protein